MVLGDLGNKLTAAISKLNKAVAIDEDTLNGIIKEIAGALLASDVSIQVIAHLRNRVKERCSPSHMPNGTNIQKHIRKVVFEELVAILSTENKPHRPVKNKTNVYLFVGLQGAGKTTTVAKFAYYWKQRGWKTAMVCADTFRAGAFDQLKQNAARIKVPFAGSYVESNPVKIAADGVKQFKDEGYEIILVDSSGRHKQEADLFDEMQQVLQAIEPNEVIFVVDSSIGASVSDQAAAFRAAVPIGSVIITKLDGHARGGGALSAVASTGSPITFIGVGEHFDEFEKFEPTSFVSRLLGMGDMKGLIETFKEKTDVFEKGGEMMERLTKGLFTLRDMREQFNTVLKVGSVGQLMSMIPGMSNMANGAMGREGTARIQKFMVILDSMTNDELDCVFKVRKRDKNGKWTITLEKSMSISRMERIAQGAGASLFEVEMLMQQHKQMSTMVGKMGKSGLMSEAGTAQQMKRNPAQVMQQLQKSIDPSVMAKIGGPQNMMQMMKEMGGMEGMEEMMKQFGAAGMGKGGPSLGRGGGKSSRR